MKKFKTSFGSFIKCVTLLLMTQYSFGQFVGTPYIPLQESIIPFSFLFGGSSYDVPTTIDKTTDGGYIVVGTSASTVTGNVTGTTHGGEDWWVVKYNKLGKIEWQRLYGGNNNEEAHFIKQTSDGGYILTGETISSGTGDVGTNSSTSNGQRDLWVVKLTATGNISWQKVYGGSLIEYGRSVAEASDGYIVAGYATSTDGNVTGSVGNLWVVKVDLSGNLVWQQTYSNSGPSAKTEMPYSMIAAIDGSGYIIAGNGRSAYRSADVNNQDDAFIMKISPAGAVLWKWLYGGDKSEGAQSISQTSDGGFIVGATTPSSATGDVVGTNHGSNDAWILRLDASGAILWQKLYGGAGQDTAYSVQQTADGGFIVAGISTSSASGDVTGLNHGSNDVWLLRLDSNGAIQWERLYGGTASEGSISLNTPGEFPVKVIETSDGGFVVVASSSTFTGVGDITDTNNGGIDYWLFKTDPNGNIIGVPNIGQ